MASSLGEAEHCANFGQFVRRLQIEFRFFMWQTIQTILMIVGAATIGTWLSQRISSWSDKREYENSRNESNGHVTFAQWKKEKKREEASKERWIHEKGISFDEQTRRWSIINRGFPPDDLEQSSHAMGINELTLREEYNSLVKNHFLTGSKVPLPPWSYWLQEELDKRGMTIFDLDPQVQQAEARKAGREKEWLEAREAARKARNLN